MNFIEVIENISRTTEIIGTIVSQLIVVRERIVRLTRRTAVLDYENDFIEETIDIRDDRGRRAVLDRAQRVRFAASESGTIRDLVWGDGEQLAGFRVSGARKLGVKREGGRKILVLALEPRPGEGASRTVLSRRTLNDAFGEPNEYFDLFTERPTKKLSLKVVFPKSRPPREAHLVQSPQERHLRRVPIRYRNDGRPVLSWTLAKPVPFAAYSLRWSW